jgi:hypothetical protein
MKEILFARAVPIWTPAFELWTHLPTAKFPKHANSLNMSKQRKRRMELPVTLTAK